MPLSGVKLHVRAIRKFRGNDYSSNDLDRDVEYFKDSENIELSYSNGVRGRLGYRPLLTGLGFTDVFNYKAVSENSTDTEEIILCNGFLWRVKEVSFTISGSGPVTSSFGYDFSTTVSRTQVGVDDTLEYNPLTLTVNNIKYSTTDYPNIGSLIRQLNIDGHTITMPTSTQTLNWGRLATGGTYSGNAGATLSNPIPPRDLELNDIFGVLFQNGFRKVMFLPVVVSSISGSSITMRLPVRADSVLRLLEYPPYFVTNFFGFYATPSSAILSVSNNVVTVAFPEPIPCANLFQGFSADFPSTAAVDFSFLGYSFDSNTLVDYSAINANESLFVSCETNPSVKKLTI